MAFFGYRVHKGIPGVLEYYRVCKGIEDVLEYIRCTIEYTGCRGMLSLPILGQFMEVYMKYRQDIAWGKITNCSDRLQL